MTRAQRDIRRKRCVFRRAPASFAAASPTGIIRFEVGEHSGTSRAILFPLGRLRNRARDVVPKHVLGVKRSGRSTVECQLSFC